MRPSRRCGRPARRWRPRPSGPALEAAGGGSRCGVGHRAPESHPLGRPTNQTATPWRAQEPGWEVRDKSSTRRGARAGAEGRRYRPKGALQGRLWAEEWLPHLRLRPATILAAKARHSASPLGITPLGVQPQRLELILYRGDDGPSGHADHRDRGLNPSVGFVFPRGVRRYARGEPSRNPGALRPGSRPKRCSRSGVCRPGRGSDV